MHNNPSHLRAQTGLPTDLFCLATRMFLAGALLVHPASTALQMSQAWRDYVAAEDSAPSFMFLLDDIRNLVVGALLVLIAVWIAFGLRTRVMALLAAAIAITFHFATAYNPLTVTSETLPMLLTLIAALPLIAIGGGRFSLWRGGWREIL